MQLNFACLNLRAKPLFRPLQAAEDEALAREAARLELERERAKDPEVEQLRVLIKSATPVQVAAAVRKLDVEGGIAGRMRVLMQARRLSSLKQLVVVLMP